MTAKKTIYWNCDYCKIKTKERGNRVKHFQDCKKVCNKCFDEVIVPHFTKLFFERLRENKE